MARQNAWRWALISFIVTMGRGQVLSAGFEATLKASLVSLFVAYGLGLVCGELWQQAFNETGRAVPNEPPLAVNHLTATRSSS